MSGSCPECEHPADWHDPYEGCVGPNGIGGLGSEDCPCLRGPEAGTPPEDGTFEYLDVDGDLLVVGVFPNVVRRHAVNFPAVQVGVEHGTETLSVFVRIEDIPQVVAALQRAGASAARHLGRGATEGPSDG